MQLALALTNCYRTGEQDKLVLALVKREC